MHVGNAAVAWFLAGAIQVLGESSMTLPGSPPCKSPNNLGPGDLNEWTDFIETQVPPLNRFRNQNQSMPRVERDLVSQEQRSQYITATYIRLCWNRVLDEGRCQRAPDEAFLWACAAAYGSFNAGTYMRTGINEFRFDIRKGSHPIEWLFGRAGAAPSVKVLGEANARIFDTVAWQHFAAAKCGAEYTSQLLYFSQIPEREKYQEYWLNSRSVEKKTPDEVPVKTERLLAIEQRLIQPMLEKNRFLLGEISKLGFIHSGVGGAPSFRDYVKNQLGVSNSKINFSNFSQRYAWEKETVVPRILKSVLAEKCAGADGLKTLDSIVRDRAGRNARIVPLSMEQESQDRTSESAIRHSP